MSYGFGLGQFAASHHVGSEIFQGRITHVTENPLWKMSIAT